MNGLGRSRRGVAGLDALIMFLAVMLVVGVVAAALINISRTLSVRDQTISKEKSKEIQQPILMESVRGFDDNGDGRLDQLIFVVRLRAGDEEVDLNNTVVVVNSKVTNCSKISYGQDDEPDCGFTLAYGKRGPNFDQDRLNLGDLIELTFSGPNVFGGVEDSGARFTFIPSHGSATVVKVLVPERIKPKNMVLWPLND